MAINSASLSADVPLSKSFSRGLSSGAQLLMFIGWLSSIFMFF
jgi:hypothetical protein